MTVTEAMRQRRSVRTYTGKTLDGAAAPKIKDYIGGLKAPFGAKCRIAMISAVAATGPVKLGTYGFIKGATDYIVLLVEGGGPLAEEGAAYMFEQVILYCTSLGLGTCWFGGSINKSDFAKRLTLRPGERIRIVSPVGYAGDKRHLSLLSVFGSSKPKPCKPFEANFFDGRFGEPLTGERADKYFGPLEMVRLAPSANNRQSWRVVKSGDTLHFYKSPSFGFEDIDLGIALCHFEQACIESGVAGHYEVSGDAPQGHKAGYVISWIGR